MKRYFYDDSQLIIGTDREIRSLYERLRQRGYTPMYTETPRFSAHSIYGIDLMDDGFYTVINSDTIARLLLCGVISGEGVRV